MLFSRFNFIPIAIAILARLGSLSPALAAPTTQQWIDQLTSGDPPSRDLAEAKLIEAGKPVCDLLKSAAHDERPEVRLRATRALRQIRLFELHDPTGRALAEAYNYLNQKTPQGRKPRLNSLFQLRPQPNEVLARLCILETDDDLRRQILYQLGTGYRDAVPRLVADDEDTDAVVYLLNEAATMWGHGQAADDAMVLYLTGKLDDQIAFCTAEQINGDHEQQDHAAAKLCYMYRVSGKSDQAMKFARLAHDPGLVFLVLQDQGDWAAAAKEPDDRWRDLVMTTGFKATFQRLAGQSDDAIKSMEALRNLAGVDTDPSFFPSRFFLLNDQPKRGIELLTPEHPAVAFAMHVLRGDISAALEVARTFEKHPLEGAALRLLSDDLHQSLGETHAPVASSHPQPQLVSKPWQDAVFDLQNKKYQRAADEFSALWAQDHFRYERFYLQGYAQNAAGQTARGQAMMHTAELIPLGDPMSRWELAEHLDSAGLTEAAIHQRELALRGGGDVNDAGFSKIYYAQAERATEKHQWQSAADALDRWCAVNLSSQLNWIESDRLLIIPALAHRTKAREARERHNTPGALEELKLFREYDPFSSETVIEWTPALDELGEHREADEIFDSVYEKLSDICQKYPKSVVYQNQLAWMSACCGRKLDVALKAAESIVQLNPDSYQLLDTLAEVHFRRGEREAAIETEKRALVLTNDSFIQKQLKRFERGAIPSTTQPGPAPE